MSKVTPNSTRELKQFQPAKRIAFEKRVVLEFAHSNPFQTQKENLYVNLQQHRAFEILGQKIAPEEVGKIFPIEWEK